MALTSIASATDPVDLNVVGESWAQTNREAYAWTSLPVVDCLDERSGRNNVTSYKIPNLENAMKDAGGLVDVGIGDDIPTSRAIAETDVTFTVDPRGTQNAFDRPLSRPVAHRLADVEGNLGPMLLAELFQGIEADMVAFLANASNFTSNTFQGTGALKARASDQKPDVDIETDLQDLRKFQGLNGMELVCIMDHKVCDILRGHPNYVGAGEGSNSAKFMPQDQFLARFQAVHRIDRIIITKAVANTARRGQTASLREVGHGLLWFGICDTRRGSFDLKSESSFDAPDGAIQLALSRAPEVISGVDTLKEVETFYGKTSFKWFSPRGSSFGFYYPASEIL